MRRAGQHGHWRRRPPDLFAHARHAQHGVARAARQQPQLKRPLLQLAHGCVLGGVAAAQARRHLRGRARLPDHVAKLVAHRQHQHELLAAARDARRRAREHARARIDRRRPHRHLEGRADDLPAVGREADGDGVGSRRARHVRDRVRAVEVVLDLAVPPARALDVGVKVVVAAQPRLAVPVLLVDHERGRLPGERALQAGALGRALQRLRCVRADQQRKRRAHDVRTILFERHVHGVDAGDVDRVARRVGAVAVVDHRRRRVLVAAEAHLEGVAAPFHVVVQPVACLDRKGRLLVGERGGEALAEGDGVLWERLLRAQPAALVVERLVCRIE